MTRKYLIRIVGALAVMGFVYGIAKLFFITAYWVPIDGWITAISLLVACIITWFKPF